MFEFVWIVAARGETITNRKLIPALGKKFLCVCVLCCARTHQSTTKLYAFSASAFDNYALSVLSIFFFLFSRLMIVVWSTDIIVARRPSSSVFYLCSYCYHCGFWSVVSTTRDSVWPFHRLSYSHREIGIIACTQFIVKIFTK